MPVLTLTAEGGTKAYDCAHGTLDGRFGATERVALKSSVCTCGSTEARCAWAKFLIRSQRDTSGR